MSHYSMHEEHVRVDFWKPSGEWYTTEELVWKGGEDISWDKNKGLFLHDQFKLLLQQQIPRFVGMRATCLEPYHELSHPISIMMEAPK